MNRFRESRCYGPSKPSLNRFSLLAGLVLVVAVLLAPLGSVTLPPTTAVTLLTRMPVVPGATVPVTVKLTFAPTAGRRSA